MTTLPPPSSLDARGSSPASRLRRSLFRLLDGLDDLRPTGIVRVCVGAREVGRLVASGGRLCMAMPEIGAPVMPARDADPPCPEAEAMRELRAMAAVALVEGSTLAGAVLDSGREAALRRALLEEAARGLVGIVQACADVVPTLEVAPTRDDYPPRLTLGTAEVFVAALRSHLAPCRELPELEAVPSAAAALLLRAGEPGELPYPVAQRGLDDLRVRQVVALMRLAMALSLGLAPETEPVDETGSWTCASVEGGLLLARSTLSASVVDSPSPLPPPALPVSRLDPGSPDALAPAVEAIPSGMIWPPLDGRVLLRATTAEKAAIEIAPDGTWQETRGRWRLHSSATDVFPAPEPCRTALLDWARWCAGTSARLSQPRSLFAAPAYDGTWRLWQLLSLQGSLRATLDQVAPQAAPQALVRHLVEIGHALADAHARLAPLGLRVALDTVGVAQGIPRYIGLAPRPGAAGDPGPLRPPSVEEVLLRELAPEVDRLRSLSRAELSALARQLEHHGAAGRPAVAGLLIELLRRSE